MFYTLFINCEILLPLKNVKYYNFMNVIPKKQLQNFRTRHLYLPHKFDKMDKPRNSNEKDLQRTTDQKRYKHPIRSLIFKSTSISTPSFQTASVILLAATFTR